MRLLRLILPAVLLILAVSFRSVSQSVLLVEKPGSRVLQYKEADLIRIKLISSKQKISDIISRITDTSVILRSTGEVLYRDIGAVYTTRWGAGIISGFVSGFGLMFFSLDVINNTINSDWPAVRENTGIISAAAVTAGGIFYVLSKKKCAVKKNKYHLKKIEIIRFTTP